MYRVNEVVLLIVRQTIPWSKLDKLGTAVTGSALSTRIEDQVADKSIGVDAETARVNLSVPSPKRGI